MQYQREHTQMLKILHKFFWTSKKETKEEQLEEFTEEVASSYSHLQVYSVLELFKEYGLMLAGGAINSLFSSRAVKDLDFYFKEQLDASRLQQLLNVLKETYGYKETYKTNNAITLKRKGFNGHVYEVQLITRFMGEPKTILDTFDYTIVQGLYDFTNDSFFFSDNFLVDIARRRLEFTSTSQYPICALIRSKKYQERGYTISGANLVSISLAIHRLEIKTYGQLKEQLLGIDTTMFNELTKDFDDNKIFDCSEFVTRWLELQNTYFE